MKRAKNITRPAAYKSAEQRGLFLALATVIPLVVVFSMQVWQRSAYSGTVFHLQGFINVYGTSVYKYRVLGSRLLLEIYYFLTRHYTDHPFLMPGDSHATFLFYAAYCVINSIFFSLFNLLLLIFIWDKGKVLSDLRLAQYFFIVLVVALSSCAVTPYDQIAYFLMLVAFLSVKLKSSWRMYFVLGAAAIAGSLNRETEFLITPALLTVGLFAGPAGSKRFYRAGLYHLFLFAIFYVGLRVFLSGKPEVTAAFIYGGKWGLASLIVAVALFYIGFKLAIREYLNRRPTIVLLILSAPYIITILLSGEIRELRLLVPLLLCLFFVYIELARLKTENEDASDGWEYV
jgi:hypothetical protein